LIIVDSSALVAILLNEPDANRLEQRLISEVGERLLSVVNYVEAGTVLAGRNLRTPARAIRDLDAYLAMVRIELRSLDETMARTAMQARISLGRGFGGALNFGDCFAYALAKTQDAPLLYVGDDFGKTDIRSAL
jgi:ribonuclease VapC